jgi:diguanylate cyclase (GGDEF)-like protein
VPSIADAFYLPGYLLAFVSLFLLVHRHTGEGARTASVDSAILSTAVGITIWAFVVEPVMDLGGLSMLGFAVTAAYPLIDVAMLGLAVTLMLLPGRHPRAARLVVIALVFSFASDLAWTYQAATGTYVDASIVDLGWWIGPMFWGAAALHPSMTQLGDGHLIPAEPVTRWRIVALAIAATVAPLIVMLQVPLGYEVNVELVEVAAISLSLMVVLRLTGTLDALAVSLASRSELQGALSHQARHDPLTGLANRFEFAERLATRLADPDRPAAILLLDLDDFKAVNDSHGHPVGDALLVQVAERLRQGLRERDVAARLGGDEFALLLDDCPDEGRAVNVAERLLGSFGSPFEVDDQVLFTHGSIGVALATGGRREPEELLRDADIAMYLAKGQGKGRAEVYRPTMHASLLQRIGLRADLQEAIANRQFVLQYQPIFSIADRRLVGVEALVRWQHPVRGMLPPSEFIGLAEETGLIVPLGRLVLDEACRQLADWRACYPAAHEMSVAVNVSAVQLQHPAFIGHLREALRASGVPPSHVVLELTESVLTDSDNALRVLSDMKAIGVRIALDDFGTGYSSLSYVSRFPIDVLKIDRAFTMALGTASKDAVLTATIIELAATLDLVTIAEGVEEEHQLRALGELGCELAQGFFLARPLEPAVVAGLLDAQARSGSVGSARGRPVVPQARRAVPVRVAIRGGGDVASNGTSVPAGAAGRRGRGAAP